MVSARRAVPRAEIDFDAPRWYDCEGNLTIRPSDRDRVHHMHNDKGHRVVGETPDWFWVGSAIKTDALWRELGFMSADMRETARQKFIDSQKMPFGPL